jgi:hypothetical protein
VPSNSLTASAAQVSDTEDVPSKPVGFSAFAALGMDGGGGEEEEDFGGLMV